MVQRRLVVISWRKFRKFSFSTVTVSPTGLVTAHYATQVGASTQIVASLQEQNVTLTDVVRMQQGTQYSILPHARCWCLTRRLT